MSSGDGKRAFGKQILLASLLVTAGLALSGVSLIKVAKNDVRVAQATQSLQPSPAAPAESKPGGARPTTPAPEPDRPDAQAQKEGAKPALPPAPAEKVAPPIQQK